MASFAFCCHFNRSASDEKPLVDLVTKFLTSPPTLKQMSCFRRFFAEAYATIASDIEARVEASEDASIKKLEPADRAEQQSRLKGIDLSGVDSASCSQDRRKTLRSHSIAHELLRSVPSQSLSLAMSQQT